MGARNLDGVIVAVADDMEASVMATLVSKEMGVPYVMAKAKNKLHATILERIGAVSYTHLDVYKRQNVHRVDRHTVKINGKGINDVNIEYDYIKKIRASYYLLGALLGKYKRAEVALPGGCNIGSRPIDQHIKGFRALGADVDIEYGKIMAEADRLVGKHIYFDVVSVGATINVMMAATMADGLTIMENVAKEPHVVDVANFLNSMGANIRGAGTDVIKIRGVQRLHSTESVSYTHLSFEYAARGGRSI